MRTILVTGAAGFIGFHLAKRCLERGERVVSIDNINDYYDVRLKFSRLKILERFPNFEFHRLSLEDRPGVAKLFESYTFDRVVHLAAQADRKSTRLNSSHEWISRMPSSA